MIKGFVQGQTLKLSQTKVVAGSIDYLIAKFTFNDAEWASLDKWMHLKKGESVYAVRLQNDRTRKEDHLNLDAGEWSVWLHGNSQEDGVVTERITTNVCTFTVEDSGVLSGDALPELPASLGEQVMVRMDALEAQMGKAATIPDASELEDGQVLTAMNGKWQAVEPKGVDVVVDAELSETSENPVQNKVIMQAMNTFAEGVANALANVSTPTFDLAALGLATLSVGGYAQLQTDTTEIRAALDRGAVKFVMNVNMGSEVSIGVVMNNVGAQGEYICTHIAMLGGLFLFMVQVLEDGIVAAFLQLDEIMLPYVSTEDEGKFLQVSGGKWTAVSLTDVSTEGA